MPILGRLPTAAILRQRCLCRIGKGCGCSWPCSYSRQERREYKVFVVAPMCKPAKGGPAKGGRHHHFQARPRRSYYDDPKRLNFRVRMGSGALLLVWSRSLVIRCFGYIKIFSVGLLQLPAANNDHDGAGYNSSHSHALPTHAPPSTYPHSLRPPVYISHRPLVIPLSLTLVSPTKGNGKCSPSIQLPRHYLAAPRLVSSPPPVPRLLRSQLPVSSILQ